jgi:hypothetical protein
MTYDIDKAFADLDAHYPGSKRKRREATPVEEVPAWDAKPIIKKLGGVDTEFFLLGALANALGKSPVTLRLWERKAYIPKSPYRLPATTKAGKTVPGKRVFTRELIDIAVQEFASRGLLGAARVEWNQHDDLTIAIFERWTALTETAN